MVAALLDKSARHKLSENNAQACKKFGVGGEHGIYMAVAMRSGMAQHERTLEAGVG